MFEISHAKESTCSLVPDNFVSLVRRLVVVLTIECSDCQQMAAPYLVNPDVECPLEDDSKGMFQRMDEGILKNEAF